MKEVSCEIIRDLLPLYEDNAVSPETAELVQEHLKGCRACRDELGKLRAPVSLPPEPEEDAFWTRFREGQAQHRRAVRRRILCAAVVLAALIGAALWYTRPMTLGELCPGLDLEAASYLYASYAAVKTDPGETMDAGYERQTRILEGDEIGQVVGDLFQMLGSRTYRRSLISLLPRSNNTRYYRVERDYWSFDLSANMHLSLRNDGGRLDLIYYDHGGNPIEVICSVEDPEVFHPAIHGILSRIPGAD